ncbi:amidohydrolase family protein [Agromyces sp. CFH 90414]|uniref:Amidohydrolase family protein n=1 Tax=Agromyces agglutinans TaxID=2662258 RepID=A0A6I2F4J2_9MICO|nr:amidohydrolase [Agromyces agglutinans]MRG59274.1 amidohydrolase family protein [Agromyces agglutinans]
MNTVYTHGRIFTADARRWATAIVVRDGRVAYVGDDDTARRIAGTGETVNRVDLGGATVLPGFVDGHAHVVGTGETAGQVDLWGADTAEEIQRRIRDFADEHPDAPRIRAQGWQHAAVGGRPTRELLDAAVADRPVYADAYDFHSIWLNTAALVETGIGDDTADPAGGMIHRDAEGHATGLVDETAMHLLVAPVLAGFTTDDDRDAALAAALRGYAATGVTATTDMGLDEDDLATMVRAEQAGTLTARIAGHWRVQPTGDEAQNLTQVARAVELAATHASEWLRVVGIKVMIDGTVDGCTAAVGHPYADGSDPDPVWSLDELAPVVAAADAAGLQVAMHAIGDEAARIAISAVEHAIAVNGPRHRRHRIEHLEVVERADIDRLAALGITASMQPVHADPAIQANWRAMLGDERVDRGFPWPEMTGAGAPLVFGTDSPTSPYAPLPNMFIAATRRSALDPSLPANLPAYALPLMTAIEHATRDAAWACGAEASYGRIAAGLHADFIVLDRDVFGAAPDELLEARVIRTVVGGRTVHEA